MSYSTGLILGLRPAIERRRYKGANLESVLLYTQNQTTV